MYRFMSLNLLFVVLLGFGVRAENLDSLLLEAARGGDEKSAAALLKQGAQATAVNSYGETPLILAAGSGSKPILALLLKKGAQPNKVDSYGYTALDKALRGRQLECVKLLLANGASADQVDSSSYIPIITACQQGDVAAIKLLAEAGADLCAMTPDGWTAMKHATFYVAKDTADMMSATLADYAIKQIQKTPPGKIRPNSYEESLQGGDLMSVVARNSDLKTMYVLLQSGAPVDALDKDGSTALVAAASYGQLAMVQFLVMNRANVDFQDAVYRTTALIAAAVGGRTGVVKFLLEHGANPNLLDRYNKTALLYAIEYHFTETEEILRKYVKL